MSTLAEHYYKVGNDLARRAADTQQMAESILAMADKLSEEAAAMARRFNDAQEARDVADQQPSTTP